MNPGNITLQTRRLAHNVKWLSLQELLIRLLGLATAIYLARVLTPTAFEELGLAVAMIGILTTLVQAGTGSRGTRLSALDPASIPQTRASITGLRVTITLIVMAGLISCAPTLSQTFSFSANLLILCSFLLLRPALAALLGSVYIHGALLLLGWLSTPASAADFLVAQNLMLTMIILLHVINNSAFPSASRLLPWTPRWH
ncbi:MAG: oligosaccharide flippase family protein [Xanthomonadales bacterium]|nr:oligosaccharide flippase family protein [Xanthomonadales bacterium]MDH4018332.1 oligosaccharide flippase family protein [Xanthomonadales bacterium]